MGRSPWALDLPKESINVLHSGFLSLGELVQDFYPSIASNEVLGRSLGRAWVLGDVIECLVSRLGSPARKSKHVITM